MTTTDVIRTDTREVLTKRTLAGLPVLSLKDAHEERTINLLTYGDPGVGKTVFCGSADEIPELRKVLVLDVEGGTMSIGERYPNVDVIRVEQFSDMTDIRNELMFGRQHGYRTVVLDSLTEMQKLSMDGVMGKAVKDSDVDPDIPRMRDWGANIAQMRRIVRQFRDLPLHVLFTALEMSDKDSRTGVTMRKPSMSGKVASEVSGFMDLVLYMYVKEIDANTGRYMLSGAAEGIVAKDRSGKLPPVIGDVNDPPTMKMIYELINAK